IIKLSHVSRLYPARAESNGGVIRALDDISLEVAPGEWLAVMAPSGSGKSTLANLIGCLHRPTSGEIWLDGEDVARISTQDLNRARAEKVGFIFQQFHLIPYLTALENVMLAQYVHSMTDRGEAVSALRQGGLGERLEHLPSQLSGGEQQRVGIARALINQPPLILADEPTGNLDAVNEAVVMTLLADLHRRGHTLVLVTHDPSIAARAGREIRLEHGRLARLGEPGDAELQAVLVDVWRALAEEDRPVPVTARGIADLLAQGLLVFTAGRIAFTD